MCPRALVLSRRLAIEREDLALTKAMQAAESDPRRAEMHSEEIARLEDSIRAAEAELAINDRP